MTWRKIYCLDFEDSKTNVDEVGSKVDLKRARRMFTCQSSVHGGVFQISRKGKFIPVFDIICVTVILRIRLSTERFLRLSRFEYWEFLP